MLASNETLSEDSVNYLILRSGATKPMSSISFKENGSEVNSTEASDSCLE